MLEGAELCGHDVAIVLGGTEDVLAKHVYHYCCAWMERCGGPQPAHDLGDGVEQAGVLAPEPRSAGTSQGAVVLAGEPDDHDHRGSGSCRANDCLKDFIAKALQVPELGVVRLLVLHHG